MDEKHGRSRDPEAAREAFLSAAEAIFARAGFDGARVEEIAARAGYNKALLFHYFGDKLGLYQAVVTRHCDQVAAGNARMLGPVVPADDTPLTRDAVRRFLEAAVRWSFDFCQSQPLCARVLSWEAAEGWTTFRRVSAIREQSPWIEEVQRFLRRARAAGFLRSDLDPRLLVAMVMGLTHHYHQALPRFELMFADAGLSTSEALAAAREQMVRFVVRGAMTDAAEESEMEGKHFNALGV
ncbi:MAG: TetR/AcrR family transcriptional regulator [Ktedonobacterales bacterium]